MGHRPGDDGPEISLIRAARDLRGLGHGRQHTGPRTKVVIDAEARHAGVAGDGPYGGPAWAIAEQRLGRLQDRAPGAGGCRLPARTPVGTSGRRHLIRLTDSL